MSSSHADLSKKKKKRSYSRFVYGKPGGCNDLKKEGNWKKYSCQTEVPKRQQLCRNIDKMQSAWFCKSTSGKSTLQIWEIK
jgi:hypothetical protein